MVVGDFRGQTIALAASGGLDSCTITRWLVEEGVGVVALTADLGQPDEGNINDVPDRMRSAGANEAVVLDARDELALAGIEIIQCQACYEGGYWNTTGIARHITVAALLRELRQRSIRVLGHGATGRGNDQVRFQLVANMLSPDVSVYAPWRDSTFLEQFPGRQEMIAYCEQEKIPIRATIDQPYSTDANLLGLTHEAGQLEDLRIAEVRRELGVQPLVHVAARVSEGHLVAELQDGLVARREDVGVDRLREGVDLCIGEAEVAFNFFVENCKDLPIDKIDDVDQHENAERVA